MNWQPGGDTIGFIGLGSMGEPIARNLLEAGWRLRVHNRTPEKADPLIERGAQRASRPADAAERGGIVVTMVADDRALEEVTLSEDGILERLGPGGVHLSMSTVSAAASRELAARHAECGSHYVAAPVFGRPDAAEARKLWICVAGERAAKERIRPLLAVLGQGVFDFGEEPAAASIVKLGGNFLIASALEALAEVCALMEKNGIGRSAFIEVLAGTLFDCPVYKSYGAAIAEERFSPAGFRLELGLKDADLVLRAAAESRVPMPLASLLHDRFLSGVAKGRGDMDWAAIALGAAEDAGLNAARPEGAPGAHDPGERA